MKKTISLILAAAMLTGSVNAVFAADTTDDAGIQTASAEDVWYSGTCGDNATWELGYDGTLTIKGTGAIKDYDLVRGNGVAYDYKNKINSVVIEEGITYIGARAFGGGSYNASDYSYTTITSVTLPSTLLSIGDYAFNYATSLQNINLPENLLSIGTDAFSNCTALTSVDMSETAVKSLGNSTFYNCNKLTSIKLPNELTTIGSSAFYSCTSLSGITLPSTLTSLGAYAFKSCSGLLAISLPGSLNAVPTEAFRGCTSLQSLIMGNGIQSIGKNAFYDCTSLQYTEVPNSVTTISDGAFYNCWNMANVFLGSGLKTIGKTAFYNCSALTKIIIPTNVSTINDNAFQNCASLNEVYLYGDAGSLAISNSAFNSCSKLATVYCVEFSNGDNSDLYPSATTIEYIEDAQETGIFMKGDLNGDKSIDASDLLILYQIVKTGREVTANELFAGDLVPDGSIKGPDYTLLRRYVAGYNVTIG